MLVAGTWSTERLGNIFWKKKNILAWIEGIQRAFERGPSVFPAELEKELQHEYGLVEY